MLYRAFRSAGYRGACDIEAKGRILDLSYPRFDRAQELTELPDDLAVLMVGISARQAASPTATGWARIGRDAPQETLFAPLHGAFNGAVAAAMQEWKEE